MTKIRTGGTSRAVLDAAYGRRRMYDVRDYVGADDMGAAINRAITAAAADGPGRACRSRDRDAAGIVVSATSGGTFTDLNLSGNETYQNGTAGSVTEGVGIRAGVTRLTVQGGRSGKGATATQTIGLNILAGVTVSGGLIDGIDLSDNTTPMNVGGTLTGVRLGVIPGHTVASGTPEGSKVAPVGTVYQRTDGGAGTALYVKETGSGTTGWAAK